MKDEIDDIRESLDRLEAESQRRKNKLLEQVDIMNNVIVVIMMIIVVIMMISVVIVRIMIKQEENLLVELGFLILLDLSLFCLFSCLISFESVMNI